jgi:hypothetical protein
MAGPAKVARELLGVVEDLEEDAHAPACCAERPGCVRGKIVLVLYVPRTRRALLAGEGGSAVGQLPPPPWIYLGLLVVQAVTRVSLDGGPVRPTWSTGVLHRNRRFRALGAPWRLTQAPAG